MAVTQVWACDLGTLCAFTLTVVLSKLRFGSEFVCPSTSNRDLETQAGALYGYASRLRTRVTAGAERKIWRSGSCSGNEFASCIIVARLRSRCDRADSRHPHSSSIRAAVACTFQAANGTSKPCTVETAFAMQSLARA